MVYLEHLKDLVELATVPRLPQAEHDKLFVMSLTIELEVVP